MRRLPPMLGLLAAAWAGPAAAQAPPAPIAVPPRPNVNAPPPPGRGLCTEAAPCRSALGESFYYTPSGDKRYLTRR
ncbi:MAG: hypothetical protein ACOYOH_15065 [Paracraurococcus sp.]